MAHDPLSETFSVEADGALMRTAVPRNGGAVYRHACPLASFEQVAHEVEEAGDKGVTLESLRAATGLAHSRITTALAFLKERGIVQTGRKRRCFAASLCVHLDAMTEYHALREGEQG